MSGNDIPILMARQFSSLGLINLQRVSMSRCGLTQVDGHAFGGLTNMVELDLSSNQLQEVNKFLDKATACCILLIHGHGQLMVYVIRQKIYKWMRLSCNIHSFCCMTLGLYLNCQYIYVLFKDCLIYLHIG